LAAGARRGDAAFFARAGAGFAGRGPRPWTDAARTSRRGLPKRSGRVAGRLPSTLSGSSVGLPVVVVRLSAMSASV
jgi:hypothetical protein